MSKIFVTSDLHFGHTQPFLWGSRGFRSSLEHDEAIIANWNNAVSPDDEVYVLGDLMLENNNYGVSCVRRLNGTIYLVRGNHDSDHRWEEVYIDLPNVHRLGWAHVLHYRKYHFYLSHFPTLTGNIEKEYPRQMTLNIHGHTHSKEKFYEDKFNMFNACLDAHNNTPVLLDDIIEMIKEKFYDKK